MINEIVSGLASNIEVSIPLGDSKWKRHEVPGYEDNTLRFSTAQLDGAPLNEVQQKTIAYYLDNEAQIYKAIIAKLKKLEDFDELYYYPVDEILEANEMEFPEEITEEWLAQNVKLIAINMQKEVDGHCFLELDFAVSWDEEHGMIALLYQDRVLEFNEGGYVWSFDLGEK